MKRTLLLLSSAALFTAASAQSVLFTETFENYAVGALLVQSAPANWDTWSGGGGTAEDTPISDAYANGGTKSAVWTSASAAGGPNDVLLLLGDRTTGSYALDFFMYIPTGKGGYFNIQHLPTPGAEYAADFFFLANGTVEVQAQNVITSGSYPHDAWFRCSFLFDLDGSTATFAIDFVPVHNWPFNTISNTTAAGTNQLSSIDFFTYVDGIDLPEFYIDDINFVDLSVGINENAGVEAFNVYPVPSSNTITVANERSTDAAQWRMLDMSGRQVMTSTALVVPGAKSVVDISALAPGAYTMELTHGNVRERHAVVRN